MWIVRDGDGKLKMFADKPVRSNDWSDYTCTEKLKIWHRDVDKFPPVHYGSKEALYDPHYQIMFLDPKLYPEVTWESEPLEIEFSAKSSIDFGTLSGKLDDALLNMTKDEYERLAGDQHLRRLAQVSWEEGDYVVLMPTKEEWSAYMLGFEDGYNNKNNKL